MCNNSENAEAAGTPVIGLGAALEIISFFSFSGMLWQESDSVLNLCHKTRRNHENFGEGTCPERLFNYFVGFKKRVETWQSRLY